jgi:hypothetical protein
MMIRGRCSCGETTYYIDGESVNAVLCFCSACQKAAGSDRFFGVWYHPDQFNLVSGHLTPYERVGESGHSVTYHFCKSCGTTVYGDSSYGIKIVSGSTLEEGHDIKPKMAIYTESAPSWTVLPKDIPCSAKMPDKI